MKDDHHADVLLVTVTKVETKAVLDVFSAAGQQSRPHSIDGRVYFNLGTMNATRVVLTQSEMGAGGLGAAQQAVTKGIMALTPSAVIMVGIAFGVSDEKQAIGDVLVTEQLRLYDLQRVGTDTSGNVTLVLRGDKVHPSPQLLNLFRSAELAWEGATVRFGTVLTGEKLIDNIDFRDQLRTFEPESIGGEMEGAGLYVAYHDRKVDWILVKAICDWADGEKSIEKDSRQALAAKNAAAYAAHVLKFVEVDWGARKAVGPPRDASPDLEKNNRPFEVRLREETASCVELMTSLALDVVRVEAHTDGVGVFAEHAWIQHKYPKSTMIQQALVPKVFGGNNGKPKRSVHFDVIQIKLSSGREKQVWFDISAFFGGEASPNVDLGAFVDRKLDELYQAAPDHVPRLQSQEATAMNYKSMLAGWRAAHPGDHYKFFTASVLQTRLQISLADAQRLIEEGQAEGWIVGGMSQGTETYRLTADG